jgi:hypothetical protein
MVTMTSEEWRKIGEAIVVWTGWGRSAYPSRDEELLIDCFGTEATTKLLPIIRELEDEFYSSDARYAARDLAEMAAMSADEFMKKHPELSEDAAHAFAWCYTFDYK